MVRVGDGDASCPDPGVVGDDAPVESDSDCVEIGGDVDYAADCGRVDGVVVGVEADVVVAAEADPVPPAQVQRGVSSSLCK